MASSVWKYCLPLSAALLLILFTLPLGMAERGGQHLPLPQEENAENITVLPPGEVDGSYTVRVLHGGTVAEMTMGEYLQGVVRAEMPASFEQEALCAQAVAARTYTLYKMLAGSGAHPEADICTDYACCQAYRTAEDAAASWGGRTAQYEAKIRNAVSATDGAVIVSGGVPVLAVFHASSAGQTRRAGEVWSRDLPYLQSVASPESAESVPEYYSRREVPLEEFKAVFLAAHPGAVFSADPRTWITDPETDPGGNVDTVTVGGVTVRGVEVRQLYGLRSAAFEAEPEGEKIVFFVTGSGHGVGMSQYGANVMAAAGASWREIIQHYYTGVSIEIRGR